MMKELRLDDNARKLIKYIDRFPGATVLVIGDIIMDEYIWGDVSRISPEAPVPVVDVRQDTKMLGGAANVINNIASLGGRAILCGVVGDDGTGKDLIEKISALGLSTEGILIEPGRPTTIKTRIVAHSQQVVRFDREVRRQIRDENTKGLLDFVKKVKGQIDAVVVSDYGKGVISAPLMKGLRKILAGSHTILAVDPKPGHFEYYHGIDVITPNHHEAGAFCRMMIVDDDGLIQAGKQMLSELKCRSVLITQGRDGMTLFETNGEISHIPTMARKVFDVTGAGDTVISTFSLGLASGMDLKSAAVMSNLAAGIVVGEVGTSTVKAEELKQVIRERLKRL
jgi:D-beta-D-heptose 7-phosphate kinase/D-beta-D-heptose 1-phosphate adenosyltransferase